MGSLPVPGKVPQTWHSTRGKCVMRHAGRLSVSQSEKGRERERGQATTQASHTTLQDGIRSEV
jgi:hypothetical protein